MEEAGFDMQQVERTYESCLEQESVDEGSCGAQIGRRILQRMDGSENTAVNTGATAAMIIPLTIVTNGETGMLEVLGQTGRRRSLQQGAEVMHEFRCECGSTTDVSSCLPECSEDVHGYEMLLTIDESDLRLSCKLHKGLFSWAGAVSEGSYFGDDHELFLSVVKSGAGGVYMIRLQSSPNVQQAIVVGRSQDVHVSSSATLSVAPKWGPGQLTVGGSLALSTVWLEGALHVQAGGSITAKTTNFYGAVVITVAGTAARFEGCNFVQQDGDRLSIRVREGGQLFLSDLHFPVKTLARTVNEIFGDSTDVRLSHVTLTTWHNQHHSLLPCVDDILGELPRKLGTADCAAAVAKAEADTTYSGPACSFEVVNWITPGVQSWTYNQEQLGILCPSTCNMCGDALPGVSSHAESLSTGKPATLSHEATWGAAPASNAVNGIRAYCGSRTGGSYLTAETEETQEPAWWQVDLGSEYPVGYVDVYSRTGCCQDRLVGALVVVSETSHFTESGHTCGTLSEAGGHPETMFCGVAGRYVSLYMPYDGQNHIVQVCEVDVFSTDSLTVQTGTITFDGGRRVLDPPSLLDTGKSNFTVQSGPCATFAGVNGVSSCVGRQNGYGPDENCTIVVGGTGGVLSSDPSSFICTESGSDEIHFPQQISISGCEDPSGMMLGPGDIVRWTSDYGWAGAELCEQPRGLGLPALTGVDSLGGGWAICF